MSSKIRLDAGSKKPLYRQLAEAITEKIHSGELSSGERLPSVRDLALEVRINPNTVARAYRELEVAARVVSEPGRGVFIRQAEDVGDLPVELAESLDHLVETAHRLGFPPERLEREVRGRLQDLSHRTGSRKEE